MDFSIFGYLAAVCTAVSFLPQAVKTVRTKNTEGLSLITYVFLFFGSLFWFIYGIYTKDVPLVATNTLTTVFTFFIVFIILKNRN
tara:strand:+ start:346 stop:600 length:255 start_codon:yes stop_codon:yes gene_type:complete